MGTSMDRHAFASRDSGGLRSAEAAAKMAYKKAGWSAAYVSRYRDAVDGPGAATVKENDVREECCKDVRLRRERFE